MVEKRTFQWRVGGGLFFTLCKDALGALLSMHLSAVRLVPCLTRRLWFRLESGVPPRA